MKTKVAKTKVAIVDYISEIKILESNHESNPAILYVIASSTTSSLGWTNPELIPLKRKEKNLFEFDFVAIPPSTINNILPIGSLPASGYIKTNTEDNLDLSTLRIYAHANHIEINIGEWIKQQTLLTQKSDIPNMNNLLIMESNYHFGPNYNIFQKSNYVGFGIKIPIKLKQIDTDLKSYNLIFTTKHNENYSDQTRIIVKINDQKLNQQTHTKISNNLSINNFHIQSNELEEIFHSSGENTLSIEFNYQNEGNLDIHDFILTKIESRGLIITPGD